MVLSFDFLPDLVNVVHGHEPSDRETVGVGWGGKGTHFPARKASMTGRYLAEPSKKKQQDKPSFTN